MSPLLVLPLLAALIGFTYTIIVGIYNVFLHPLRKYPGPILDRMTQMVQAYHLYRGTNLQHVMKLHETYGRVVRVSPTALSYIDEQAWPEIYGHASSTHKSGNLPKDSLGARADPNGITNIIKANNEDHRRLRRIQTHMFSEKVLLEQEPLIKVFIKRLVTRLQEKASSPSSEIVNIVQWYNYTTFDILGELAFGESFHCLESDHLHPWIGGLYKTIKDSSYWVASQRFPWPLNKLIYMMSPSDTKSSRYDLSNFGAQKVRDRLAQDSTDRVDFMSYILKYNDEKGMSLPEIESNATLLIMAGSETTASYLSGVTYHLLINPEYLHKLTNILRTTFPLESDITVTALNQLDYLSAIINEGFRTYPPVPIGLPRRTPAGGSIICGELVPENTSVSGATYVANMSPLNWTDPQKFVPERWYKDDIRPERYHSDRRKVMNPFSMGPRNCIGRNLALAELRLILAHLFWSFDLEIQSDSLDWINQKAYGLWEKKTFECKTGAKKILRLK